MCIFLRKSVKQALVLSQSLQKAKEFIVSNSATSFTSQELESLSATHIQTAPLAIIDYAEVLSYPTLEPFENSHSTSFSYYCIGREIRENTFN